MKLHLIYEVFCQIQLGNLILHVLPLVRNFQLNLPEPWTLSFGLIAECKPEKKNGENYEETQKEDKW